MVSENRVVRHGVGDAVVRANMMKPRPERLYFDDPPHRVDGYEKTVVE